MAFSAVNVADPIGLPDGLKRRQAGSDVPRLDLAAQDARDLPVQRLRAVLINRHAGIERNPQVNPGGGPAPTVTCWDRRGGAVLSAVVQLF